MHSPLVSVQMDRLFLLLSCFSSIWYILRISSGLRDRRIANIVYGICAYVCVYARVVTCVWEVVLLFHASPNNMNKTRKRHRIQKRYATEYNNTRKKKMKENKQRKLYNEQGR